MSKKLSFAMFAAAEESSLKLDQKMTQGKLTPRNLIQIASILNFFKFLASNRFREDFLDAEVESEEDREFFQRELNKFRLFMSELKFRLVKLFCQHASKVSPDFFITIDHIPGKSSSLLSLAANSVGYESGEIDHYFPNAITFTIGKNVVHHKIDGHCLSSLLDRSQACAWVPDMIFRREGRHHAFCGSVTNSCREIDHLRTRWMSPLPQNRRCPRALAQENLDRAYSSLGIHFLGSVAGGKIINVHTFSKRSEFERQMMGEIGGLAGYASAECMCGRCVELTIPMRVPISGFRKKEDSIDDGEMEESFDEVDATTLRE